MSDQNDANQMHNVNGYDRMDDNLVAAYDLNAPNNNSREYNSVYSIRNGLDAIKGHSGIKLTPISEKGAMIDTSEAKKHVHDKSSWSTTLNYGEEDEMKITGYRKSKLRTTICWICFILSLGLLRLFMHWRHHWLLIATHVPCSLKDAEMVLISEHFEKRYNRHYVKKVLYLGANRSQEIKKNGYNTFSIHMSGGEFKITNSVRVFQCKHLRYIWDEKTSKFMKLKGLDVDVPLVLLHQLKALDTETRDARREVYGLNEIFIPLKGVVTLLFLEVLNPFYVFQVFSVCLWFSYNYYYYAVVIITMSVFGITMTILQTRKNQLALKMTCSSNDSATVLQSSGCSIVLDTKYLVPGDLLEIPKNGCIMQCDAVLLSGNCILDESLLTGECVPVTKTPLPYQKNVIFNQKEHSRHMLYSGTKVIQTRYIGTEKVLARVINTGNITTKGGLIRSIIYPPPVDYKFEQDSYKFILLLGIVAGCGFIYTLCTKILRGVAATKIAIESLDLITIAVPPALPAAMTVGSFYAQKRLEENNIYCISPRSITIAGSINCVCFDKTGTLTEDGLDMWGVVPLSSTNIFEIPMKDVSRLPQRHLLFGMVTCHSITSMNDQLKGDPLDLKMFESTGWILEEANVSDANKYDLLSPTIVRPPKFQSNASECAEEGIIERHNNIGCHSDNDTNEDIEIGIIREFSFTSSLQRMSVITRKLGDQYFCAYSKGSPETISSLCKPETIPDNFYKELNFYADQGYRVIALAYKQLEKKVTYAKIQRMSRDTIENDLSFLGLVILENRLKPDTTSIINSLSAANIRSIMVTGDNILTALSVARDCNIIKSNQNVIIVSAIQNIENKWELVYNLSGNTNTSNDLLCMHDNPVLTSKDDSAVSINTLDTYTHTSQLHDDVEMQDKESMNCEIENECNISDSFLASYRFAMDGKTWSIINQHYSQLLERFITRGSVFARMSPDQKQALVLEIQNLGFFVAFAGDGANDCGALKAAHAGISLSEAESSVASPFTSKNPTIACVPTVIREGRCALATSVAIFKFMAAYSLVQFASVLILYTIDSNLTDFQFLYIDLFMISVFAFFFGRTSSFDGPLAKEAPLNSLLTVTPIASLFIHLVLAIGFQMIGWYHLHAQPWFEPFNYTNARAFEHGCYENYTVFVISCFQYIILAFVFAKGAPYRKTILSNKGFLISLISNTIFSIIIATAIFSNISEIFHLVVPPDTKFHWQLIFIGCCNFILSSLAEIFLIEYLIYQKLQASPQWANNSQKKYLSIENFLRRNSNWPPICDRNDIHSTTFRHHSSYSMSSECFSKANNCLDTSKNTPNLEKNGKISNLSNK